MPTNTDDRRPSMNERKEKGTGRLGPGREQIAIFNGFPNPLPIQLRFKLVLIHRYRLVATDAFELIRHVVGDVVIRLSPRNLLLFVFHSRVIVGTTVDSVECSAETAAVTD